jgi:hypothetical protein
LAQAVGLQVPGSFQVSYSFVPALKALNEKERDPTGATVHKRPTASSPQS